MSTISTDPAQAFTEHRQRFMTDADALGAAFFYFSPVNVVPKLWLGKLSVVPVAHTLGLVDGQGGVRLIPHGSQRDYYGAVLEAVEKFSTVLLVPEWAAKPLGKVYGVAPQHREYLMGTEQVVTHSGGRNAAVRGNVNKARRTCHVAPFEADQLAAFLAVNKAWYRQVADTKFRTYDKVSLDTLLTRWAELFAMAPDARCLGVWEGDALQSLNIGSMLTARSWTAYTQRFDREGVKAANTLGYMSLAEAFSDTPIENDGTGDSKEIRAWKDRLGSPALAAFKVTRK